MAILKTYNQDIAVLNDSQTQRNPVSSKNRVPEGWQICNSNRIAIAKRKAKIDDAYSDKHVHQLAKLVS